MIGDRVLVEGYDTIFLYNTCENGYRLRSFMITANPDAQWRSFDIVYFEEGEW